MRKILTLVLFLFVCLVPLEAKIVISEVLANADGSEDAIPGGLSNEFIELVNIGTTTVDLSGWSFTDGDGLDYISTWTAAGFRDKDAVYGTIFLQPGQYAVILNDLYVDPRNDQPFNFGPNTLILRVADGRIGDNSAGLSASSDPLTLYRSGGQTRAYVEDTYGTPVADDLPDNCDDNYLDSIPFDPGDGRSAERIDLYGIDISTNWAACQDIGGSTPGRVNSVALYRDSNIYPPYPENFTKVLQIEKSLFFPRGDISGKPTRCEIFYDVPMDAVITLKIFDIRGNCVFTIYEQDPAAARYKSRYWDGKDANGNIVPTGVYIVYFEAIQQSTGKIWREQATVVAGSKL